MQENKEVKENVNIEEEVNEGMSFWDHLEVLRWALFRSACVLTVCLIGTFWALPHIFDDFILAATSNDFFVYRWLSKISHGMISFNPDFNVQIININVASQFMTHISTSISLAAVIAFPYFIWEIWKFVAPALYENERRAVRKAFLLSSGLFYLGVVVGYFVVLPVCLMFFVNDVTGSSTMSLPLLILTPLCGIWIFAFSPTFILNSHLKIRYFSSFLA